MLQADRQEWRWERNVSSPDGSVMVVLLCIVVIDEFSEQPGSSQQVREDQRVKLSDLTSGSRVAVLQTYSPCWSAGPCCSCCVQTSQWRWCRVQPGQYTDTLQTHYRHNIFFFTSTNSFRLISLNSSKRCRSENHSIVCFSKL